MLGQGTQQGVDAFTRAADGVAAGGTAAVAREAALLALQEWLGHVRNHATMRIKEHNHAARPALVP